MTSPARTFALMGYNVYCADMAFFVTISAKTGIPRSCETQCYIAKAHGSIVQFASLGIRWFIRRHRNHLESAKSNLLKHIHDHNSRETNTMCPSIVMTDVPPPLSESSTASHDEGSEDSLPVDATAYPLQESPTVSDHGSSEDSSRVDDTYPLDFHRKVIAGYPVRHRHAVRHLNFCKLAVCGMRHALAAIQRYSLITGNSDQLNKDDCTWNLDVLYSQNRIRTIWPLSKRRNAYHNGTFLSRRRGLTCRKASSNPSEFGRKVIFPKACGITLGEQ
jgi:hypothetical protein